jgi:heme/copper-type cytochrome/quinol oxidase subunit 2
MIRRLRWLAPMLLLVLLLAAVFPQSALAAPPQHEAPAGSEWIMADWMFLSFMVFAGVAFLAFILALKAGLLANLESAKYYVLDIDEEDYYTPDWARDGGDE